MAGGDVIQATTFEQVQEVLKTVKDKPVVVDYFAEWCGPCMVFAPKFKNLASEFGGNAVFMKINVDEVPDAAEAAQISSLPTFVVYYNGAKQGQCIGAVEEKLRNTIADVQKRLATSA
jgi:thioredoxin